MYLLGPTGNFNWINTSNITDFTWLFTENNTFNGDISRWDTSNVVKFDKCFIKAIAFDSNINDWDISSATSTRFMFEGASNFN